MKSETRCIRCGSSGVQLFPGLDGHLHYADCAGMLLPSDKPERPAEEEHHG